MQRSRNWLGLELLLVCFLCLALQPASAQSSIGHQIDHGPTLPTTCKVGQIYFQTTTATIGLYQCATANTWTSAGGGGGGSSAFDAITAGTNTTAAMVVGTGASLAASGSGTIVATSASGNAATATALATPRAIYGNNFDGSAALTQIIASTFGGTGNGFAKFSGPASTEKTFTLPNASATVLTDNAAVTVAQGGTGIASGTSGGIPYYSGSTTIASSGALTANVLPKGGGAGAAPTNSLLTDNATTATYTGTGGVSAPLFTATGTTAGVIDFPQGTTNSGASPCTTATSICEQAPTAVTSYLLTKPGAAPTIASIKITDACAASSCTESFRPKDLVLSVASDFITAANTNLQNITGLGFTFPANVATIAAIDCDLEYNQQTAAVADAFGVQDVTVAPTSLYSTGFVQTAATTWVDTAAAALTTTTATNIIAMTPSAITTLWHARLHILVEQPSNASTSALNIMVKTGTSADTVTVKRGSFCTVKFQ